MGKKNAEKDQSDAVCPTGARDVSMRREQKPAVRRRLSAADDSLTQCASTPAVVVLCGLLAAMACALVQ